MRKIGPFFASSFLMKSRELITYRLAMVLKMASFLTEACRFEYTVVSASSKNISCSIINLLWKKHDHCPPLEQLSLAARALAT